MHKTLPQLEKYLAGTIHQLHMAQAAYSLELNLGNTHKAWQVEQYIIELRQQIAGTKYAIYLAEMQSIDLSVLLPGLCTNMPDGPVLINNINPQP